MRWFKLFNFKTHLHLYIEVKNDETEMMRLSPYTPHPWKKSNKETPCKTQSSIPIHAVFGEMGIFPFS